MCILDLLLPRRCAVCMKPLEKGEECLCAACREDMPLTYFWEREKNPEADKLNDRLQCLRDSSAETAYEPYARAASLFFYRGEYRSITKAVKYEAAVTLGSRMGDQLGRVLASSPLFADADMVIPVPLHPLRRLRRGYNQAEVIAGAVAAALGSPLNIDILKRSRRTRTQTHLSVDEKAANVSGAFVVRDASLLEGHRHILLVDDVFTTGSTLAECLRALRLAIPKEKWPAVRISVCTLACVGD